MSHWKLYREMGKLGENYRNGDLPKWRKTPKNTNTLVRFGAIVKKEKGKLNYSLTVVVGVVGANR